MADQDQDTGDSSSSPGGGVGDEASTDEERTSEASASVTDEDNGDGDQDNGGLSSSPGAGGVGNGAVPQGERIGNGTSATFLTSLALRHDPGISTHWMAEEQAILELMLRENTTEPKIIRYSRIARHLPGKTIRDVALRIKWMTDRESGRKRRDDHL
ncbi:hypothetical protein AXF42_Ash009490 [Apostasia shenzhenica]|uniref:Myb-like domain-containing protein n=1 Tax=Apostasia shenzhenica TaxID=1088818 RepID=A0A2I0B8Z8_9ASPA|nr:hypothetical protein AXF42_Ash009490 [Apostasia shenzhenica]